MSDLKVRPPNASSLRGRSRMPKTRHYKFACYRWITWCRGRIANMSSGKASNAVRLAVVAVVMIAGAYWAGGRWGERQPRKVEALPLGSGAGTSEPVAGTEVTQVSARDAALTD